MAAAPTPMPPPPGGAPPPGAGASPSPASPSPQIEQGSSLVIKGVQAFRALAQLNPSIAPLVEQINDLARQIQVKLMQGAAPPEPAAPPMGG